MHFVIRSIVPIQLFPPLQLKTLQTAHEREMSANKETVRLLEQRLAERDEAFAIIQKHHKIPIDYFALKAKVNLKKS